MKNMSIYFKCALFIFIIYSLEVVILSVYCARSDGGGHIIITDAGRSAGGWGHMPYPVPVPIPVSHPVHHPVYVPVVKHIPIHITRDVPVHIPVPVFIEKEKENYDWNLAMMENNAYDFKDDKEYQMNWNFEENLKK